MDRTEQDGRSSTDSTVPFLDGKPREYKDLDCNGTQSCQRADNRTVEITRTCVAGAWMRFIRRVNMDGELVLEASGRVNFVVPAGVLPGPAVSVRLTYIGRSSNTVTIGVQ